jgi:hypothetical protein
MDTSRQGSWRELSSSAGCYQEILSKKFNTNAYVICDDYGIMDIQN